ncbi:hypothetical protein [Planctobacterium marinum]|uniref:Uncharacterized protein n=1 Tax=Planctobacterium marinum TaxID=1631968 RepID=A0AA48HIY7_9ALTE|nr:hypothetical protein MACH26_10820 [Planctobacterium marinum]
MDKKEQQEIKDNAPIMTGLLTEFAFWQSLKTSKTLQIMTIIGLLLFSGLGWLLYKMTGA